MTSRYLHEWMRNPESMDAESLEWLRQCIERYPYFQTARLLYLMNLYVLGDDSFKDELRANALYMADLSVLFYYIEGERLSLGREKEERKLDAAGTIPATDRTLDLIDRFLSALPAREEKELSLPVEATTDYATLLEKGQDETPAPPLKGQALIDTFIETGSEKPVMPADTPETEEAKEPDGGTNLQDESDESCFTETLAKIYVKQKRYEKALEIIKRLNLNYPKKNAYFADQIRFLEKLIINAKSK